MGLKNNITNKQKKEFLDRIIYPMQFKNKIWKLIYHIYNVFYPICNGSEDGIKKVIKKYLPNTETEVIYKHLETVASKYDATAIKRGSIIRYDCFSCIEMDLTDEDMYFEFSVQNRKVTLAEIKFILQRITKKIYTTGYSTTMTNKYFMNSGLKTEYKKYTKKAISTHKLAHIFQVLTKYNYLHITYNSNSSRVIQLGPNNPFYILEGIPEVDEQTVITKTDRTIVQLAEQTKMLQSVVDLLKEEIKQNIEKVEQLQQENGNLQQDKELLVNLIIERDEEIKQLQSKLQSRLTCRD